MALRIVMMAFFAGLALNIAVPAVVLGAMALVRRIGLAARSEPRSQGLSA